jgi:putative oxidoreductase
MKGITRADFGLLVLRLGVGLTMLFFGSQKMLGVFGGMGYMPTVNMMHDKMSIPTVLAHLAIFGEFCGGLGLIFGLLTPVASFGVACTMAVATYITMKPPGVFSAIFEGAKGADPSKLFFSSVLCCGAISLLIMGPGRFSFDSIIFKKKAKK